MKTIPYKHNNWKLHFALFALAAAPLFPAQAQQPVAETASVEEIGLLPHQKEAVEVPPNESNPFAIVSVAKDDEGGSFEDSTLQEQKIRQHFESLAVGGIVRGPSGPKVLIGSMILREGEMVPPVIANQTERLMVTEITDSHIEISWVESDDVNAHSPQTRVLRKELDVSPGVAQKLPGTESDGSVVIRRLGDLQAELSKPRAEAEFDQ